MNLIQTGKSSALLGLVFLTAGGCARYGDIGAGNTSQLIRDAKSLAASDPARLGPYRVQAEGVDLESGHESFPIVVYRPEAYPGRSPAVVFLPGRFSPEDEYEGYARLLASRGYVVAVRGRYSWWHHDTTLVHETRLIADWLSHEPGVDGARIGVAGHSMGGCDSISAAARDPRFRAVVAIEPGGPDSPDVIHRVIGTLRAPLLLIGADRATLGREICGKRETNYQRYYEHSPEGTVELELRGADHMQVMDDPDRFGMSMCRVGTADSLTVRTLSRRATVAFFEEHLRGAPHTSLDFGGIARVRTRSASDIDPKQPAGSKRAAAGGAAPVGLSH
jgi:dienelactone hydrolase